MNGVLLVLDLEATCWSDQPSAYHAEHSDVIEIGLATLELRPDGVALTDRSGIMVKPTASEVSPFCTELTGIKPGDVAEAMAFPDACKVLRKEFNSKGVTWGSWGDYDRVQLKRQCAREQVAYPFGRTHMNLKALHAMAECLKKRVGMPAALKGYGLELEGRHHCGADDAWNIARIAQVFLGRLRAEAGA